MLKHRISPAVLRLTPCLLIFLFMTCAFSEEHFELGEEPVEIQSDKADFQESTGNATHRGHVKVKQGARYLSADLLIIHRTQTGKIDRMTAQGQPARFEARPNPQQSPVYGEAKTIEYFLEENKIVLLDQAQLLQDGQIIQGPSLTYYLTRRVLSSESVEGQQTKVILKNKGHS